MNRETIDALIVGTPDQRRRIISDLEKDRMEVVSLWLKILNTVKEGLDTGMLTALEITNTLQSDERQRRLLASISQAADTLGFTVRATRRSKKLIADNTEAWNELNFLLDAIGLWKNKT